MSQSTLDVIVAVLRKRATGFGLAGARVQQNDANQIVIELPTTDLSDEQLRALTAVGLFEVIDTQGTFLPAGTRVDTSLGSGGLVNVPGAASPAPDDPMYRTIVSSAELAGAYPSTDSLGQLVVEFEMTVAGSSKLLAYTEQHIGEPMSVVVDKTVIESGTIQAAISVRGVITGLSAAEVATLAAQLDAGALTVSLTIVSTEQVL